MDMQYDSNGSIMSETMSQNVHKEEPVEKLQCVVPIVQPCCEDTSTLMDVQTISKVEPLEMEGNSQIVLPSFISVAQTVSELNICKAAEMIPLAHVPIIGVNRLSGTIPVKFEPENTLILPLEFTLESYVVNSTALRTLAQNSEIVIKEESYIEEIKTEKEDLDSADLSVTTEQFDVLSHEPFPYPISTSIREPIKNPQIPASYPGGSIMYSRKSKNLRLTNAEKQRRYRQRQRLKSILTSSGLGLSTFTHDEERKHPKIHPYQGQSSNMKKDAKSSSVLPPLDTRTAKDSSKRNNQPLTNVERQRRFRERRKLNAEKTAKLKKKAESTVPVEFTLESYVMNSTALKTLAQNSEIAIKEESYIEEIETEKEDLGSADLSVTTEQFDVPSHEPFHYPISTSIREPIKIPQIPAPDPETSGSIMYSWKSSTLPLATAEKQSRYRQRQRLKSIFTSSELGLSTLTHDEERKHIKIHPDLGQSSNMMKDAKTSSVLPPFDTRTAKDSSKRNNQPLTNVERQRRFRERRKLNAEKTAKLKKKAESTVPVEFTLESYVMNSTALKTLAQNSEIAIKEESYIEEIETEKEDLDSADLSVTTEQFDVPSHEPFHYPISTSIREPIKIPQIPAPDPENSGSIMYSRKSTNIRLTNAEKQRRYRQRLRLKSPFTSSGLGLSTLTHSEERKHLKIHPDQGQSSNMMKDAKTSSVQHPFDTHTAKHSSKRNNQPLTNVERQRRFRDRRKLNAEKTAKLKKKAESTVINHEQNGPVDIPPDLGLIASERPLTNRDTRRLWRERQRQNNIDGNYHAPTESSSKKKDPPLTCTERKPRFIERRRIKELLGFVEMKASPSKTSKAGKGGQTQKTGKQDAVQQDVNTEFLIFSEIVPDKDPIEAPQCVVNDEDNVIPSDPLSSQIIMKIEVDEPQMTVPIVCPTEQPQIFTELQTQVTSTEAMISEKDLENELLEVSDINSESVLNISALTRDDQTENLEIPADLGLTIGDTPPLSLKEKRKLFRERLRLNKIQVNASSRLVLESAKRATTNDSTTAENPPLSSAEKKIRWLERKQWKERLGIVDETGRKPPSRGALRRKFQERQPLKNSDRQEISNESIKTTLATTHDEPTGHFGIPPDLGLGRNINDVRIEDTTLSRQGRRRLCRERQKDLQRNDKVPTEPSSNIKEPPFSNVEKRKRFVERRRLKELIGIVDLKRPHSKNATKPKKRKQRQSKGKLANKRESRISVTYPTKEVLRITPLSTNDHGQIPRDLGLIINVRSKQKQLCLERQRLKNASDQGNDDNSSKSKDPPLTYAEKEMRWQERKLRKERLGIAEEQKGPLFRNALNFRRFVRKRAQPEATQCVVNEVVDTIQTDSLTSPIGLNVEVPILCPTAQGQIFNQLKTPDDSQVDGRESMIAQTDPENEEVVLEVSTPSYISPNAMDVPGDTFHSSTHVIEPIKISPSLAVGHHELVQLNFGLIVNDIPLTNSEKRRRWRDRHQLNNTKFHLNDDRETSEKSTNASKLKICRQYQSMEKMDTCQQGNSSQSQIVPDENELNDPDNATASDSSIQQIVMKIEVDEPQMTVPIVCAVAQTQIFTELQASGDSQIDDSSKSLILETTPGKDLWEISEINSQPYIVPKVETLDFSESLDIVRESIHSSIKQSEVATDRPVRFMGHERMRDIAVSPTADNLNVQYQSFDYNQSPQSVPKMNYLVVEENVSSVFWNNDNESEIVPKLEHISNYDNYIFNPSSTVNEIHPKEEGLE